MRKLLVVIDDETFTIEVPPEWRVTYGVTVKGGYTEQRGRDLRIYEGTHARAVFTNVVHFRDLSLKVEQLKVNKDGTEEWMTLAGTAGSIPSSPDTNAAATAAGMLKKSVRSAGAKPKRVLLSA